MPIIKSAKKRVKVAAKANVRNSRLRREVRETLKAYAQALESGNPPAGGDKIAETQRAVISAIDNAAKQAVIHKNKAARKKAQLSRMAKAKGIKQVKRVLPKTKAVKSARKPAKKTKPAK